MRVLVALLLWVLGPGATRKCRPDTFPFPMVLRTYCWMRRFENGLIVPITEHLDAELITRAFG